jgi:hypothetical protein
MRRVITSDYLIKAFHDGEISFDGASRAEPEIAWTAIMELSRQPLTAEQIAALAAGPLEDLLAYHGPAFIDRVEQQARVYPTFRRLLGGVWQSSITAEVWRRIEHIRGATW